MRVVGGSGDGWGETTNIIHHHMGEVGETHNTSHRISVQLTLDLRSPPESFPGHTMALATNLALTFRLLTFFLLAFDGS